MADDPNGACFDTNFTDLRSFRACVREQALAQMKYMSSTQAALFTLIYTFISLLGVLGNGLVIFVVARKAEMRTTRNVFIVNLALSNFFLALILVPFLWLPTFRIEFPYGAFVCKMAQAFPSTNIFCSTLTISVIAVDRYYVIVRARLGPGNVKTWQAVLIAVAIWIISLALSILYFLHFHIKDYTLPSHFIPSHLMNAIDEDQNIFLFQRCELKPRPCGQLPEHEADSCYRFYETALCALTAAFIYFVPMPVLVVFSYLLTRYLSRSQRQQSSLRHHVCLPMVAAAAAGIPDPDQTGMVGAALMTAASGVIGRTHADRSNWRNRNISNMASSRRRSRTTSLLLAMSFSNAILWLPFVVVSMILQLAPFELTIPLQNELRQLDDAAKLISMLSICVNPVLYGYLNTNFNREFKLIFSHCCPFSSSDRDSNAASTLRSSQRRAAGTKIVKTGEQQDTSDSISAVYTNHPGVNGPGKGRVFGGDLEDVSLKALLQDPATVNAARL